MASHRRHMQRGVAVCVWEVPIRAIGQQVAHAVNVSVCTGNEQRCLALRILQMSHAHTTLARQQKMNCPRAACRRKFVSSDHARFRPHLGIDNVCHTLACRRALAADHRLDDGRDHGHISKLRCIVRNRPIGRSTCENQNASSSSSLRPALSCVSVPRRVRTRPSAVSIDAAALPRRAPAARRLTCHVQRALLQLHRARRHVLVRRERRVHHGFVAVQHRAYERRAGLTVAPHARHEAAQQLRSAGRRRGVRGQVAVVAAARRLEGGRAYGRRGEAGGSKPRSHSLPEKPSDAAQSNARRPRAAPAMQEPPRAAALTMVSSPSWRPCVAAGIGGLVRQGHSARREAGLRTTQASRIPRQASLGFDPGRQGLLGRARKERRRHDGCDARRPELAIVWFAGMAYADVGRRVRRRPMAACGVPGSASCMCGK
eukprot:366226-Chlamydomonas_euryale.AAC.20